MDRSPQQKINTETLVLNDTWDERDLIDTFRTLHPNAEEYIFFSSAHRTFSRIDHILGHKSHHSKFKKIEIVSGICSDHNAMRQVFDYKKKSIGSTNIWRLSNTFVNKKAGYWRNLNGTKKISRNKW